MGEQHILNQIRIELVAIGSPPEVKSYQDGCEDCDLHHTIDLAELEDLKDQHRSLQNESLRDKDELQQLKSLYKVRYLKFESL